MSTALSDLLIRAAISVVQGGHERAEKRKEQHRCRHSDQKDYADNVMLRSAMGVHFSHAYPYGCALPFSRGSEDSPIFGKISGAKRGRKPAATKRSRNFSGNQERLGRSLARQQSL
jgi:hypothetical protein